MRKLLLALLALTVAAPSAFAAGMVNAQTGTTYTFTNADCDPQGRLLVTFNNAASVAVTLPQAGLSGFFLGGCIIHVQNIGLGSVTITPTTSTIAGQTALVLPSGDSFDIYNDSSPAATGNYLVSAGGAGPGGLPEQTFRNIVQNGDMAVQQRGTGERTGGTTTIPSSAYSADRWGCNANVTSGAAFCAALTTTPPTGMRGSQSVYRKTGALTQPVCMMQEISTADFTPLAGQVVTLSFTAKALAGMIADNAGVMNAYIFTGTGADEGLQSFTASPAITPAFTGISSTLTKAVTLTTSYQRFSYTATIPGTATEGAVAFCFTPTATGAGVTDGFNFSGVQLEQASFASPYEFKTYGLEFVLAQRHYWQIVDPAATVELPSSCFVTAANTTVKCGVYLPTTMRAVPVTNVAVSTSFGIVVTAGTAGTCTTLAATASSNTINSIGVTCTTGGTIALGSATPLIGAATGATSILSASADF